MLSDLMAPCVLCGTETPIARWPETMTYCSQCLRNMPTVEDAVITALENEFESVRDNVQNAARRVDDLQYKLDKLQQTRNEAATVAHSWQGRIGA